jgi:hypothetical protein
MHSMPGGREPAASTLATDVSALCIARFVLLVMFSASVDNWLVRWLGQPHTG